MAETTSQGTVLVVDDTEANRYTIVRILQKANFRVQEATNGVEGGAAVSVSAVDLEDLLVRWLSELLYLYDTQRLLCCTFHCTLLEPTHLTATVAGESLDPERHPIDTEIKAVTYHQIAVEQVEGRWQARVIFDL